eukprot:gene6542-6294_t
MWMLFPELPMAATLHASWYFPCDLGLLTCLYVCSDQVLPDIHDHAHIENEKWMQTVAQEMSLSETAFVHRLMGTGDAEPAFRIRYFTPLLEVDLCGHATLASSHVLWTQGHVKAGVKITFQCKAGTLAATMAEGGWIQMDFPSQ